MKFLKHWRVALLLAALAGLQACEFGFAPGGGGTGAEGLTGIVVDGRGAPIAGARVRVYPASTVLAKGASSLAAKADSTFTQVDGRYRFSRLPAGIYELEASIRSGDTAYGLFVKGIVFHKSLDLGTDTLKAAGGLTLRVQGDAGAPVEGARCEIAGSPWKTVSDSAGVCLFAELPPGTFQVKVSHSAKTVSGPLHIVEGERLDMTARFPTGAGNPTLEAWKVYGVRGFNFYGPPDLDFYLETEIMESWGAVLSNSTFDIVVSEGESYVPAYFSGPNYKAQIISWTDTSRGVLHQYRRDEGTGEVLLELILEVQSRIDDVWTGRMNWGASTNNESVRAEMERLLASVRPAVLWQGPVSAPLRPKLAAPAASASGLDPSVTLQWSSRLGSVSLSHYRVQVSTDSTFGTRIIDDFVEAPAASNVKPSHTVGPLETGTEYYWRVVAFGAGGSTASETRRFATAPIQPAEVALVSPADNAVEVPRAPTLQWSADYSHEGIEGYRVQVASDSLFQTVQVDSVVTQAQYLAFSPSTYPGFRVPFAFGMGMRHFWRVTTLGRLGAHTVSATRSFTVMQGLGTEPD